MPGGGPPCLLEDIAFVHAVSPEPVDDPVVGPDERHLHLADEEVDVIALVAQQGDPLMIARDVVAPLPQEELHGVVLVVEVRGADRAGAVDALQVGARRAEIPDFARVGAMADRGPVGSDVVGDELAEEGPAGRHVRVRTAPHGGVIAWALRSAEGVQRLVVHLERRQAVEEPPVAGAGGRVLDPPRRQALIRAGRGGGRTHS